MKKYEIMYILTANIDDEARKAVMAEISQILLDQGAQVTDVNEWGLREFAYEIKDQTKGYYVVMKLAAEVQAIDEFDRRAKLNVNVLRHLITEDHE
ncbi:MAG: 30S ribosomal protein S6 [Bacilli bacterium]|jgi:small subunit ribosomal protein S6|nr:30S ribosomal protein S6 [Bacilli bacterium]MDD3389061.1 30S ribosomal protein S6 [Bacilli bacterium]MDD4344700.1 30S ribosomal protein S6 [Bacilli bacterium]MDD4520855.1 30S ribosomal protein S6 [Bacilli bacterium]MDY0399633.1 30S ribosomal protein S6 [Bacilli bacterium]